MPTMDIVVTVDCYLQVRVSSVQTAYHPWQFIHFLFSFSYLSKTDRRNETRRYAYLTMGAFWCPWYPPLSIPL